MSDAGASPEASRRDEGLTAWARRGGLLLALVVLAVAIFVTYASVTEIIRVWLQDRWVPVWRAAFSVGVAGLALGVILRLTRGRPSR